MPEEINTNNTGQGGLPPDSELITLAEASTLTPYSQEYISLLARKGKLAAWKKGRNWYTTKKAVLEYVERQAKQAEAEYQKKTNFTQEQKPTEQKNNLEAAAIVEALGNKLDQKLESIRQELAASAGVVPPTAPAPTESVPPSEPSARSAPEPNKPQRQLLFYLILFLVSLPVVFFSFSKGLADDLPMKILASIKNAWTVDGHRAGTNANEILILNEVGNISIKGHIETEGQLRSYARDGVAPIVIDSATKVENLNADSVDGFSSEQFTLAFVTKNGNITAEDVYLKGKVEVGKTLQVKGATKLLDSLLVQGGLGVWGPAVFQKDVDVQGNLTVKKDINAGNNVNVKQNINVEQNLNVGGNIVTAGTITTGGHDIDVGGGTIRINNTNLVPNLNAELWNGKKQTDFNLDTITNNGAVTTNRITVGGLSSNGPVEFSGQTDLLGPTTLGNLTSLTVNGPANLNGQTKLHNVDVASSLNVSGGAIFSSAGVSGFLSARDLSSKNATIGGTTSDSLIVAASTSLRGPIEAAADINFSATTPRITTSGTTLNLEPASTNAGVVRIGSGAASTKPDLLVVDVKSTTGDPTGGTNGAIYYNEASNKLRCYENDAWGDCIGGGGGGAGTLQEAYDGGNTIITSDGRQLGVTLANTTTDSDFNVSIADGSTSTFKITRADGAGTADPSQLLLLNNASITRTVAAGLKVTAAAGLINNGLDVSDTNLVNALSVGDNAIVGTTPLIDFTNFDVSAAGNITLAAGQGVDSNGAGALEIGKTTATTINIAGGAVATGCTITNATGDLVCTGNISSSSGTVGYWQRSGLTLSPATSGDAVTTSGNISTSGSGTITSAGLLTASNGLTLTTGALNLTATSGSLTLSGLSASSINTGANDLTITSNNFNTTATGINATAIGASTPSTGAFTTLSSTGATTLGNNSSTVAINSSDWDVSTTGDMTGIGAITADGLITGTLGATLSGATVSLNNNSNFATNINTGTSTGAVAIGGGAGTVAIDSTSWDISSLGVASGLTGLTSSGTITFSGLTADRFVKTTTGGQLTVAQYVDLTADVTGTLPINKGGTNGTAVPTAGAVTYGTGTAYAFTLAGNAGQVLTSGGAGVPTWVDASTLTTSAPTFTSITSGTNIQAAMVVDTGASLNYANSGTINASSLQGATWASPLAIGSSTPAAGTFTTLSATGATTLGNNSSTVAINSSDWDVSTTGDMTGIGAITADGLITGTLGATLSGATVSLNNNSNFATNINTGTSTGAVAIGGGAGTVAIDTTSWDISSAGVASGLTGISSSGTITFSGLSTGVLINSAGTLSSEAQLAIARGGTNGTAVPTAGAVSYGTGTAYAFTSAGNAGQVLISGGAGAPTWTDQSSLAIPFSSITSGTNTQAAMVVGNGASLDYTGTGTINASTLQTATWASPLAIGSSTPAAGTFTTLSATGATDINTSGSNATNIGTGTNGGTITIGNALTGDLALNDAQWSITGTGLITTADNLAVNGGTISTTAATASIVNSNATTVNMAGGASTINVGPGGDTASTINFGGGSGATGCTVNAATGDLVCAGNISGGAGAGVGYWTRSGTIVSPINANDQVSITPGISTDGAVGFSNVTTITSSTADATLYGQKLAVTNNPSTNANTVYGLYASLTDAGILANTAIGLYVNAATANANDTTYAAVFSGGNVGIGTAIPTSTLDVTGTGTFSSLLTASNGLTLTTGALNLTATSGSLTLSGLSASSINTGANDLTITSNNFNTTATGINSTAIGASTPSTGAFTTLSSTGATTLGNNSATVAINSSDWDVSTTGDMTGIGAITADGLITGSLGASLSGATISLNNNSNFATNINTGTSTGAVAIGGGAGTVAIDSTSWDISSLGVASGLTGLTSSGTITFSGLTADRFVKTTTGGQLTVAQYVDLTADVTGTLPINKGGTNGTAVPTAGAVSYGTGTAYAFTLAGNAGQVLTSGGAGAPTWVDASTLTTSAPTFTSITSGTNIQAAMVVDTGASLNYANSGTINASSLQGATWASPLAIGSSTPAAGTFTTLSATGNTQLGDATSDTLTVYPTVLSFIKENAHTIQIADTTTADTVGASLTIKGAAGTDTKNAGAINLTGGTGGAATGAATSGNGSDIAISAGTGGDASGATGTAGNGGNISIDAGAAGATNTGTAGTNGAVTIGGTVVSNINIGTATGNKTITIGETGAAANTINIATGSGGNAVHIGDGAGASVITVGSATAGNVTVRSGSALSLIGSVSSVIDFPNFDVTTGGNITVAAGQGLDVNAAGTLAIGNVTATTVALGSGAATTINVGAGGALTRTINIGTGTGVDNIHIGDGGTGADVITIGSANAGNVTVRSNAVLSLTGSTNSVIDFPSFDVATTGNITVAGGQGIDTASGNVVLQPAGSATTAHVRIGSGSASTTPDLLVLDVKSNGAGNPDGVSGGLFYDEGTNKINVYNGSQWQTVCTNDGTCAANGGTKWNSLTQPDGSLTFDHGANTTDFQWNSLLTGTAWNMSAPALTTGKLLALSATVAPEAATTVSPISFAVTNSNATTAATINALNVSLSNTPSIAGNTENIVKISNSLTTNTTDNAVAAGLLIDNADNGDAGSTVITDAIRITNSGGLASGITNGINLASSTIGTDIVLRNGNTINNTASGTITFGTDNVTLTTAATKSLTIDSGTTGALNLGTGANAKTITLGNTTTTTAVAINSGTGGITLTGTGVGGNVNLIAGGTGTGNVQVGTGAGSTTPDLLVLDNKSDAGDPTGANGAIYYNANSGKFRIYDGAWKTLCNLTDAGCGAGSGSAWSAITVPSGSLSLDHTNYVTDFSWSTLTTGTALALTANSLTTGRVLGITSTNTATANQAGGVSPILISATNAQSTEAQTSGGGYNAVRLNFTSNPSIAGNTENIILIQNQLTTNTTDNAVAAGLLIDNADNGDAGSTVITDAIRITNSGGLASGITNGINLASSTIGTDIVLRNGNTINNTASGTITFGTDNVTLTTAATKSLTIDSGTTGALNLGTGANAKTITLGNAIDTTAVNITSGSGNINMQSNGTGSGNIVIGTSGGSATTDLLVLGDKNTAGDPGGVAGAMYYNSNTNKFMIYDGAWKILSNTTDTGSGKWSDLTAPTGNLSFDHLAYTTNFEWNTLTTATAWTQSSTSLTSGKLLALTAATNTGSFSGIVADLQSTGTTNNSSTVLNLVQSGTGAAKGIVLTSAGTGNAVDITQTAIGTSLSVTNNTATNTANTVVITADGLTSGNAINVASSSTGITSGSLLKLSSTGAISNASGSVLNVVSTGANTAGNLANFTANSATSVTGGVVAINANALTTGKGLVITAATGIGSFSGMILDLQATGTTNNSSTALNINQAGTGAAKGIVLTNAGTGSALGITQSGTLGAATSGISITTAAAQTNGTALVNFTQTGSVATTIPILNVASSTTSSGGGVVVALSDVGNTATAVSITQSSTSTGKALAVAAAGSGTGLDITASGTGTALSVVDSGVTTGKALDVTTSGDTWTGNGTTNGLVNIASGSTGGTVADSSILFNLTRSGANANTAHTAYGLYSTVTNTNVTSGTNIAAYLSASGATTANYGLIVANGYVGIGNSTPATFLDVLQTTAGLGIRSVSSAAMGTGSGGGFLAASNSTPSAGDQRLGIFVAGAITTGSTYIYSARMQAYSSQAWSATAAGSYLTFMTTPNDSVTQAERMRIDQAGNIGMGTSAPDAALEINHATGDILRMTYNDDNGSAANYTDFSLASDGDLTINSSGGAINITGTLDVSGHFATGSNASISTTSTASINENYTDSGSGVITRGLLVQQTRTEAGLTADTDARGVDVSLLYRMTEDVPGGFRGQGYGTYSAVYTDGSYTFDTLRGAANIAYTNSTAASDQNALYGSTNNAYLNSAGTLNNAFGSYGSAYNNNATGTLTNAFGLYGTAYSNDAGALTNAIGVEGRAYGNNASSVITTAKGVEGLAFENAAGAAITTGYGGYFYSRDAATNYGIYAAAYGDDAETLTNAYGGYFQSYPNNAATTITNAYGIFAQAKEMVADSTVTNAYGGYFNLPSAAETNIGIYSSVTGAATSNYGLYIADVDAGTSDYGIAIAGAGTAALWLSSAADNTDAANGIAFGLSRDTNLYRSAANILKTDDSLTVATGINVGGATGAGAGTIYAYDNSDGGNFGKDSGDLFDIRDGSIYIKQNDGWEYQILTSDFSPYTTNTNDLGTSSKRWQDLFAYTGSFENASNSAALAVTNNTATTASVVSIAGSGAFTGSTTASFMTITPSGLTQGTGLYLPVDAITTGTGLSVTSSSTSFTSGKLVNISTSGGDLSIPSLSGSLLNVDFTRTVPAGTAGLLTFQNTSGKVVNIARNITDSHTAGGGTSVQGPVLNLSSDTDIDSTIAQGLTVSGEVLSVTSTGTASNAGVLLHSANVAEFTQSVTVNTGSVLLLTQSSTSSGKGITLTSSGTGAALSLTHTTANNSVSITNDTATNTATVIDVSADGLTTGTAINIASTATAFSSGKLLTLSKTGASGSTAFTGDIASIAYSQTFNGGVGLNSTGNVDDISRSITLNNAGQTHTISGAAWTLSDTFTQTAGTLTVSGDTGAVSRNCATAGITCSGAILSVKSAAGAASTDTYGMLIDETGSGTITTGLQVGTGTGTITTAIKVGSTGVTTDISLQNGETIDNDSDGTINLNATLIQVDLGSTNTTGGVCHSGADVDSGAATDRSLVPCSSTANDFAEMYETEMDVERGDVVTVSDQTITYIGDAMDDNGVVTPNGAGPITIQVLKKADKAYDSQTIGVISTHPWKVIGKAIKRSAQHPLPIALMGRVPVKVTTKNGSIKAGDYLTPAGNPSGYAMKLNPGESGAVIGIALEGLIAGDGKIMIYISRGDYTGDYIKATGGQINGTVNVTASGTPLTVDLTSQVNAVSSIFEAKVNGEIKFKVLNNGTTSISGALETGSLKTIAEAEIGGDIDVLGDVKSGGLIRMDRNGNLKNIASIQVSSKVNPDGSITLDAIPATSVGSAVSVAQTSADPVTATRAALSLSTAGQSSTDYLIYSEPFRVLFDGNVHATGIALKKSLKVGSADLLEGTLVEGTVGDSYIGTVIKFANASGKSIFSLDATGQLVAEKIKTRAIVIDNIDEPRATIGSAVMPAGSTMVTVSASEVKPGMKIFLTPKATISQSLAVTQVNAGSFVVAMSIPAASDVPFDWWLVDVTNPNFVAVSSGQVNTQTSNPQVLGVSSSVNNDGDSISVVPAATENNEQVSSENAEQENNVEAPAPIIPIAQSAGSSDGSGGSENDQSGSTISTENSQAVSNTSVENAPSTPEVAPIATTVESAPVSVDASTASNVSQE